MTAPLCQCGHGESEHRRAVVKHSPVTLGVVCEHTEPHGRSRIRRCSCTEYRPAASPGTAIEPTDALGRDWLDQAIDTLILAIGAKGERGHILPGPARLALEHEVRSRLRASSPAVAARADIGGLVDAHAKAFCKQEQAAYDYERDIVDRAALDLATEAEESTRAALDARLASLTERAERSRSDLRGAWRWSWAQPDWHSLSPDEQFERALRAADGVEGKS
jgi:hypothetical protein